MKKILNKIILCFIAITFIACLSPAKAFDLNVFQRNNEGYFQKLHSDFPVYGNAVKLKDGRVFITGRSDNLIFDPKTNKFRKTVPFNNDIEPGYGTLLNNGKVLFIGPITKPPSEKFEEDIYKLILDKLVLLKINRDYLALSKAEKAKIRRQSWQEYRQLPESEKEKIYLPVFQKNPELVKKYNDYLELYDHSMYAQLYNSESEKFEYSGRMHFRVPSSALTKTVLKDRRILMIDLYDYNKSRAFEFYDPTAGEFTIGVKPGFAGQIQKMITLNDGRVFMLIGKINEGIKYIIYDPVKNTFSEPKFFSKTHSNILKLNDGRIIFFSGQNSEFNTYKIKNPPKDLLAGPKSSAYIYTWQQYNAMNIKIYDPVKDEIFTVGHLAIPRGEADHYKAVVLKDGRIFILGGHKDIEKFKLGDKVKLVDEIEIFDPLTGKSKLIGKINYERMGYNQMLLDDGRVLLYPGIEDEGHNIEIYVPKGYKK